MTTSITSPMQSGHRPLQLVAEGTSSPVPSGPATTTTPLQPSCSAYPSPLSTGLPTPPTHSVSTPTGKRRPHSLTNSRRQSSISYFPSDHLAQLRSPSPRHPPSFSPLSPSPTLGAASSKSPFRGGSRRTASLSVRTGDNILTSPAFAQGTGKGDRRSLGSEPVVSLVSPGTGPAPDRPPLTLTEKHADLLRFIAQKESKCLELRSQLAVHEAELKELKRKWERIVSRGMDRAYSSSPPSTGTSPNPSSTPHGLASALLPTGNTGAVLGGIKEGVQDLGRLLAAGLDLSGGTTEEKSTTAAAPTTTHVGSSLGGVSKASMAPALKKARHVMTQSVSSVSTSTTAISDSTAGTRLSQSSVSSISFLDEEKVICEEPDEDETRRREISAASTEEQIQTEEVISADISISPSSANRSTKLLRRRSREVPKLPSSAISTESQDAAMSDISSRASPSNTSAKQRIMMKRVSTGLASPSSIPGLVPLSQPVSSWMGSVGKKWEEIQKGETFTKSQKRASLLLSDVSQSIFAALASPTTPIGSQDSTPYTSLKSPKASSSISISTNPFLATISPLSPSPSPMSSSASPSLLDDDFEETTDTAFSTNGKGLGEVLVPTSVTTPSKESNSSGDRKSLIDDGDDDDDWNW